MGMEEARCSGGLLTCMSTMHAISLVILLTVAAGAQGRSIPAGCREDHAICREDCTIEYGGNMKKYSLLTECLRRCDRQVQTCTDRHYTLQDARMEPVGSESGGDTVRRGVYRATEAEPPEPARPEEDTEPAANAEPAARAEPAVQTEPELPMQVGPEKLDAESIPIFDEPEAEPPPAPKPEPKPEPRRVESEHPTVPPEPKKDDIADWDPNGD